MPAPVKTPQTKRPPGANPPAAKPAGRPGSGLWSPRKWKLYLLAIWFAVTAFWMPVAYDCYNMPAAMSVYRLYGYYEQQVQDGGNPEYARRGYQKAMRQLDEVESYVSTFILNAVLLPLVILAGGAWLLRKAK